MADIGNPYAAPVVAGANPDAGVAHGDAITEQIADVLRRTRPWVLFIAILGFLGAAFMVLLGVILVIFGASDAAGTSDAQLPFPTWVLGLLYLALVPVYAWPSLKLMKYSGRILEFLELGGAARLAAALDAQRSFWKLMGVFVIATIAMSGFAVLGAMAYGVAQAL